jgi:UDP-glucose 4-epimerase
VSSANLLQKTAAADEHPKVTLNCNRKKLIKETNKYKDPIVGTYMTKDDSSVLVTGGAGFIGSHLVLALLEEGYRVTVFDNLTTGKLENLNTAVKNPNLAFIKGDIRNPADLQCAFKKIQAVVHLAAQIDVTASVKNPILTHEINTAGTLNVLQAATKHHVEKFLFASSTAVYGNNTNLPLAEDNPLMPLSPYAASKAAGEAYVNAYANCYKICATILRFFNVYGAGNEKNPYSGVITKFMTKAHKNEPLIIEGDGEQTRDFIHVNDVVSAILLALKKESLSREAFNICTGVPVSINQLVDAVKAVTGKKLQVIHNPARVGDIRENYGDTSKSIAKLGFKSKVSLTQGLKMMNNYS